MATVKTDWRTLPGIPELASVAVENCVNREEDPEAHDAACAYVRRYMGEINSEPGGQPEPLGYYGETVAAFTEGFEAARKLYRGG